MTATPKIVGKLRQGPLLMIPQRRCWSQQTPGPAAVRLPPEITRQLFEAPTTGGSPAAAGGERRGGADSPREPDLERAAVEFRSDHVPSFVCQPCRTWVSNPTELERLCGVDGTSRDRNPSGFLRRSCITAQNSRRPDWLGGAAHGSCQRGMLAYTPCWRGAIGYGEITS